MNPKRHLGFSLVETLTAVSVAAMLAMIAVPNFAAFLEARRASGATENIRAFLQFARSESIRQMRPMVVTYAMDGGTSWQLGMREGDECDPGETDLGAPASCSIPQSGGRSRSILDGANFPGISARANRASTHFDPVHGTAGGSNVTITITTASGAEARTIVSNVGRIRTCSPAGAARLGDFPAC